MNNFLRRLSIPNRNSLIRIVAIASAGSSLLYASNYSSFDTKVVVSIPEKLKESLFPSWKTVQAMHPRPFFLSSDHWHSETHPLFSSTVASSPSYDVKGASGVAEDSHKPCSGCLGRDTFANAAAKVAPAVVNISVPQNIYGIATGNGIGSGTIIDEDGTILTCAHAVVDFQGVRASSKGKVKVTLQDGRTFEGTVVNADLHSDVAIVKIKSKTPLPTAKFGSSSKLRPGDWVISLGCPLSLQNTVTAGIVSCVDRKSSDLGLSGTRREYLQTDCAVNPGNSGGPLVNIDGEVVGVNIMKVLAADGVSFAVPVDSVSKIMEHFKKSGRVVRPWLGLRMLELNETIIAQLKERDSTFPNVKKGILIPAVTPGSPGDRAGFRPGDIVIEFDGKPVESINEVIDIMGDRVGFPMKVIIKRAKDQLATLTVIPEESNPRM